MSHLQDSSAGSTGNDETASVDSPAVLIIEDDERLCRTLSRVIERIGYRPVSALDAGEAARLVGVHDVRVALIDWHLPGGTGADFLAHLRASHGSELYAIVLSGSRDSEVRREALTAGADDFVSKPLNLVELRRLLHIGITRI